jgi:hypothetical protein
MSATDKHEQHQETGVGITLVAKIFEASFHNARINCAAVTLE